MELNYSINYGEMTVDDAQKIKDEVYDTNIYSESTMPVIGIYMKENDE